MKADYVHKDSKTINDETVSYKITMPLINDEELQIIDNHYNELVDEFTQQFVKEKDMIIEQRIMMNLRKENELLLEENQQLKKQLENCYCNRTDCSSRIRNSKQYDSLVQKTEKQQKKFIEYLEGYIATLENQKENVEGLDIAEEHILMTLEENLAKYKEIIGDKE